MKNLISLLLCTLLISVNISYASNQDVIPKDFNTGDLYVRVTKTLDDKVKFESCRKGLEDQTCALLGRKAPYSVEELEAAKNSANWNIAITTLIDAGIVIGAAYGGIYLGVLVFAASGPAGIYLSIAALEAIGLGGAVITDLNPISQYQIAKTLTNDIVSDRDVKVRNMEKFIKRFSKALTTIR